MMRIPVNNKYQFNISVPYRYTYIYISTSVFSKECVTTGSENNSVHNFTLCVFQGPFELQSVQRSPGVSSLQSRHQRLHGGQEARLELCVGEASHRLPRVASDLHAGGGRQRQDALHRLGVAVLVLGQEARLAALERHHDVQLGPARLVRQHHLPCCHALHHTWGPQTGGEVSVFRFIHNLKCNILKTSPKYHTFPDSGL